MVGGRAPAFIAAFVMALVLVTAAPALAASTVEVDVFGLQYAGDDNVNDVVLTDAPGPTEFETRVTISEVGVVAMTGCVQQGVNQAYCDVSNSDSVDLSLEAGNDIALSNGTRVRYNLDGDEGDDLLTGSDSDEGASFSVGDSLRGGEGTDTLIGRAGDDNLDPEEGENDVAEGGEGDDFFSYLDIDEAGDVMRGGPGSDSVGAVYLGPDPTVGVTIDLAAGTAQFPGLPATTLESVENADGDEGADTLLGTEGINDISGDEGNDFIDGRGGPDVLEGDEDDDRLEGRDGSIDRLIGAFGTDTCDADQLDIRVDCEAGAFVELPPFGSIEADRTAPQCSVRGVPKRAPSERVRGRGLAVRASCDEAGRLTALLVGTLRRARGGAKLARAGDVELAARSRRVSADDSVRLRLRVARRFRRLCGAACACGSRSRPPTRRATSAPRQGG